MQKLMSLFLALVLFAGLAVISPSLIRADDSTATATGTITGTVVDANGNPVAGAKVMAKLTKRVAGAAKIPAVTTADDGTFTINNVPDGKYSITVKDKTAGKGKADKPVTITNGSTEDAGTITLTPPNTDNGGNAGGNGADNGANNGGNGGGQPQ
ncbi:MAG TPA: carboxypeptidase-like regulatory domain-containing protein [Phycisphaerae bacterium]|nr:carboxypeptidase-like regulatory domain-containing protein [Phycisphaerae bacterium]